MVTDQECRYCTSLGIFATTLYDRLFYMMPIRSLSLSLSCACLLASCLCVQSSAAETLSDVISGQAMEEVRRDTQRARDKQSGRQGNTILNPYTAGMDPRANFTQLWDSSRGPELLLSWLGVNIGGIKVRMMDTSRTYEDVYAYARLTDSRKRQVNLKVRIPHPNYYLMVQHKTLPQFTQYEPPKLKVVAQEDVEFKGVPGVYYRSERAHCSVVFKVEKLGIIDLSVDRCENSPLMMEIAEALDIKRLNSKLTS